MNARLFSEAAPNYSATTFPEPRPFQYHAHQALRDGFRAGHKNQMLMSPTGSGKTFLGLRIAHEALAKGKRALFICDRRTLIDQTSATADSYGLSAHGVLMANHWRYDPAMPFQIASAQTLARREIPPFDVCIVDECFTGDVEVLTERGFVRFDALQEGVRCAQFDGGRISFVTPTAYINKPYSGQLVRIHSDTLCDLTMTPSHEMLMRSEAGWRKFAAGVAPLNTRWQLAAAGEAVGTDAAPLTPLERLAIALQADGSIHNRDGAAETSLSFTFAKDRKVERFLALMESGQFRFTRVATTRERQRFLVHGLPPMSKRVWEHFDIASMSSAKAREVIAEMVEWDGHKARPSCWYYSSVVKDAADFFQCVALLAGYKTNLVIQHDARKESFSDVHRLFIQIKTSMFGAQRLQREVVEHDGRVYCIRVPSGNIVVRRDGKPVVIGNCHTQLAAWVNILKGSDKPCIGLSATPFSTGLGKLFSNLVNAATMAELTESGVLVPMRVMSCTTANMKDAATSGGEWTDGAAGERGMEIIGDVVAEWVKYGENRKTIVFGSTIAHCTELCKQFNEVGVLAQLFTSETTDDERKQILAEYRKPDTMLRVLISVEALAKGFDVPDVSCVVDCRPLRKSLSTAIQMWGRGLRSSPSTGKSDCLLLDHSGNICRFADDYAEIFYNGLAALDAGEKLDKTVRKDDEAKEPKSCPSCGFKPMGKRCVSCGFELQQAALIEVIPGAMREVVIGKTKLADNHRHLYAQIVSYERGHGKPETAKSRANGRFKDIVGEWPNSFSYERTHNVPITRAVMNKLRSLQIAFRASQQGARA